MDLTPLENLGLNLNEAIVYVALLEEGAATAGKIADKVHFHRRTAYDTLNSLKEKGFVSYFERDGVLRFAAIEPARLVNICREREAALQIIIPELALKQQEARIKTTAQVYQGLKAIKTIFEDILECREYIAFGEGMRIVESLGPFFDYFQKEKKKRKLKSRILMGEQYRHQKTVTGSYGEFRFLKGYQPPIITYVYGDKVAIIVWSESPTAFIVQSKEAAQGYRTYFDLLWKQAKP